MVTLASGERAELAALRGGSHEVMALGEDLKVGPRRVRVEEAGRESCLRVVTRLGHESELGLGGSVLGFGGPLPAGELAGGEFVAVARRVPAFGEVPLPAAHVEFLALLTAGGHTKRPETITYYKEDPAFVEALRRAAHGVGDLRIQTIAGGTPLYSVVRGRTADPDASVNAYGNAAAALLEKHGLMDKRLPDRSVPPAVFTLPRDQLALYVGRLWSSDGSAYVTPGSTKPGSSVEVLYWASSRRLCLEYAHLLARFGIVSRLRYQKGVPERSQTAVWEAAVSGAEHVAAFGECFGAYALGGRADQLRAAVAALPEKPRGPKLDVVPAEVWDIVEAARVRDGRSRRFIDRGAKVSMRHRRNLSRRKLWAIADLLGDEELAAIARSDVVWDRVASVERAEERPTFRVVAARGEGTASGGSWSVLANELAMAG